MADVTSKTALGPVTGVAEKNGGSNGGTGVVAGTAGNNGSIATVDGSCNAAAAAAANNNNNNNNNSGGCGGSSGGGFNSLPSSIHHGLSERLQGLTEKLQSLGGSRNQQQDPEGVRSRTGSLGTREQHRVTAAGGADVAKSSHTSPTKTCSRGSSKKSNHSVLFNNGKLDGKTRDQSCHTFPMIYQL